MTVNGIVIKNIIRKLLAAEDHGIEINQLITDEFLKYVVNFFKSIVSAKLDNEDVTIDWYESELLSSSLPKRDIAIRAGLNEKTSPPCKPYHRDLQEDLNEILPLLLSDDVQTSVTPDVSKSDSELLIELD